MVRNKKKPQTSRRGKVSKPTARAAMPRFNPEIKQLDKGLNLTSFDTSPTSSNPALYHVTSLANMAGGDGQSERTGIKIQARKLQLRLKCAIDPNSDATNANIVADAHTFRLVVYVDRIGNGQPVTWQDVFDYVPNDDGQLYDYPNKFQERRFRILHDELYTVPPSFVVYDNDAKVFHAYGNNIITDNVFALNHDIWYANTTSDVSAVWEGNIGFFICSDFTADDVSKCKFSYRARLEFADF